MDETGVPGDEPEPTASPPIAPTAIAATPGPPPPTDVVTQRVRVRMLAPLKIRDFRLLWTGMTVSLLGDGIFFVAMVWQALALSEGAGGPALVMIAWTVPQVLFALIGGVISDRVDRRLVLIGADVARGLALAGLATLALTDNIELWHMYILVAVYGAGDAFFMPAFGAIVPDVVPKEMLTEANSIDQFVRPIMLLAVGPAIGGLLVEAAGTGEAFLIDALTFVVSVVTISLMSAQPRPSGEDKAATSMLHEVKEGLAYTRSHVWLWGTMVSAGIALLAFYGPNRVLVPLLVEEKLGGDSAAYGWIVAAGGVGAVLASIVIGQRGLPRRSVTFMLVTWAIATYALSGYAFSENTWQASLVSFVMLFGGAAGIIAWYTIMQKLVPSDLLGRVASLDWLISTTLIPISFAVSAPLGNAIGVEETLFWGGLLGGSVFLVFLLVPGIRDVENDPALLATEVSAGSGGGP